MKLSNRTQWRLFLGAIFGTLLFAFAWLCESAYTIERNAKPNPNRDEALDYTVYRPGDAGVVDFRERNFYKFGD